MNDASPLTLEADKYRQTGWEPAVKMYKEERSMRSVTKIVVKGAGCCLLPRALFSASGCE